MAYIQFIRFHTENISFEGCNLSSEELLTLLDNISPNCNYSSPRKEEITPMLGSGPYRSVSLSSPEYIERVLAKKSPSPAKKRKSIYDHLPNPLLEIGGALMAGMAIYYALLAFGFLIQGLCP